MTNKVYADGRSPTYAYDACGTNTNETVVGVAGTNVIERFTDAFGRDAGYALNGVRQSTLAYDPATGRLATMLVAGSETPFTWNYLAGSDLKSSLVYPNGLTASWTYDDRNNLLQVRNATATNVISQFDYAYDAAGRRILKNDEQYGYNMRDELVSASGNGDYSYAYDDIGNRKSSVELTNRFDYVANALNQYVSVGRGVTPGLTSLRDSPSARGIFDAPVMEEFIPSFDADGNQTLVKTSTGIWSVTYNGENRSVRWENGGTVIFMSYDRKGRRVTKNDQRFVYNGYLQIADNSGNAYVWDVTESVATRPLTWHVFRSLGEGGYGNDSIAYYVHDGNKNVSEVIAGDGVLSAHYEYAPFGALTVSCGTSAADNPWRFSSEYAEGDTATIYYNYRHYEPVMGRWLQRDPVGESGSKNLFLFSHNALHVDWLGLIEIVAKIESDVNVALIALENMTKTTIREVFKWNKVEPYSKLEGSRPNKECCKYTGMAIEYYRKLKISYKASTDPAKIKTVKWIPLDGTSEEDIALYKELYAIVMAHENGHISIMEEYRSKLNKDFEEADSSCYKEFLLSFDELESLLQDEADTYFDQVLKKWHDVNNAYQQEEETRGRHKEVEKIKSEYDKKRRGS